MSVARALAAAAAAFAVLASATAPAAGQQPTGTEAPPMSEVSLQTPAAGAAPVLGAAFVLEGEWVASGVVWLDWDDVEDAADYELMYRSTDGWVLLADDEASGGVLAAFDGSGSRIAGLPAGVSEHWFAVRARNVQGVSGWSDSVGVAVPAYAQAMVRLSPRVGRSGRGA